MSSKGIPVDPISKRGLRSSKVLSVEVCFVTSVVPPGAFVSDSTIYGVHIIVSIFGGKLHSAVKITVMLKV